MVKGPAHVPHSHPPNHEAVKAESIRLQLKRRVVDKPEAPPVRLLRDELGSIQPEILSQLPLRENLKQAVRRARRTGLPTNPTTLLDLDVVEPEFQKTEDGEKFLLYDSKSDSNFTAVSYTHLTLPTIYSV